MKKHKLFFFSILFFIFISSNSFGQFILNGVATQTDSICYQMTPDALTTISSIWNEDQIDLNNSFDLNFSMNFGCNDIGADGMVFVLQTSPNAIGASGGDIGYGVNFGNSIAIEFDTWENANYFDLAADHIAIIRDGILDHNSPNNLAGPINASPNSPNIEDCEDHPVNIKWDADQMLLEVFFDCTLRLSYTIDIVNDIFGGDPVVYWGFTASTGGQSNLQSICFENLETNSNASNQTVTICEGEDVQIFGSNPNVNYSWNPSTDLSNSNIYNPIASPSESTIYVGTGIDACGNEFMDSINVIVQDDEIVFEVDPIFSDTTICEGESFVLNIQTDSNNDFDWQNNFVGNTVTFSQPGIYEVTISNACTSASLSWEVASGDCMLNMPNTFTPNSDGVNDFFGPVTDAFIEIVQFKIYNRWGQIVYDEKNIQGWDGTQNGKASPSDVYIYIFEYVGENGSNEFLTGDVTLIR